jgi:uncharacterized membrane protein YjgN (DUF898 family)
LATTPFGQRTVKLGDAGITLHARRDDGLLPPAQSAGGSGGPAVSGERETIHPFEFRGSGSEYFRIWIVNLALTLAILGIYSAWAAVRSRRYFLGNTVLDGHTFDYHARPMSILIGRIVVVVALLLFQAASVVSPFAQAVMTLVLLIALPWLINNGLRFNAAMTSYRNVRFGFHGAYMGALTSFVLMPMLGFLTLGLLFPVASRMQQRYIASNTRWGSGTFAFESPLGPFYRNLFATLGFAILAGFAFGVAGGFAGAILNGEIATAEISEEERLGLLTLASVFLITLPTLLVTAIFYAAGVRNLGFRATTLDGRHRLVSAVSRLRYVWILVSNLILTMLTAFLYRPWASLRTWQYLAGATALATRGTLDGIVETEQQKGNVGASQYLDIDGFSFGI